MKNPETGGFTPPLPWAAPTVDAPTGAASRNQRRRATGRQKPAPCTIVPTVHEILGASLLGDPERRRDQRKPEAPENVKQSWQSCVAQMKRRRLPRSARASVIKDAASGEWRQESQDCQTEPKRKRPGEACGPRRRGRPAQADAVQPTSLFEGAR